MGYVNRSIKIFNTVESFNFAVRGGGQFSWIVDYLIIRGDVISWGGGQFSWIVDLFEYS